MEKKKTTCCNCKNEAAEAAVNEYPGAAIDVADDEKVTKAEVKERTSALNNNPRNQGDII